MSSEVKSVREAEKDIFVMEMGHGYGICDRRGLLKSCIIAYNEEDVAMLVRLLKTELEDKFNEQ